jgi:hypothetical protein
MVLAGGRCGYGVASAEVGPSSELASCDTSRVSEALLPLQIQMADQPKKSPEQWGSPVSERLVNSGWLELR